MYYIFDWTYKLISTARFDTFEDAWAWVYENIDDSNDAYDDLLVLTYNELNAMKGRAI